MVNSGEGGVFAGGRPGNTLLFLSILPMYPDGAWLLSALAYKPQSSYFIILSPSIISWLYPVFLSCISWFLRAH